MSLHGISEIKAVLDGLELTTKDYFLAASGAMVVHGIRQECDDLDMYIAPPVLRKLSDAGILTRVVKPGIGIRYTDANDIIDSLDTVDVGTKKTSWWLKQTEVISDITVLSLYAMKEFYKEVYRLTQNPKHKNHLQEIIDFENNKKK